MTNDSSSTFTRLQAKRSSKELDDDIRERLTRLMEACAAQPTSDGWRRLAIYLLSRLPEFRFERQPGDESTMHLPLMRIESALRTNYPVLEAALDEAVRLQLSSADTDGLVERRLAEAPPLSIARAVRIEAGLDGIEENNWSVRARTRYDNLLREYRREKHKDALFTSAIRRGAHKSLRAWFALENAFSQLEIQHKAKELPVNKDDLEPEYD